MHSDPTEPADRSLRRVAPGKSTASLSALGRAMLHPATDTARAVRARVGPVLTGRAPALALQGALLEGINLTAYNDLGPADPAGVVSRTCTAREIDSESYATWCGQLGQRPRYHRKQWEHVVVLQEAARVGLFVEGRSALGFGVGTEPLPAALAAHGVRVLATDQPLDAAAHWTDRGEHAASLQALEHPRLCAPEEFRANVRFRAINMTDLPDDVAQVDLIWSCCVIEHLGSPAEGLDFVLRSLDLLRPGGLAVHTTELELRTKEKTADYGHCAVYRLPDLFALQDRVRAAGFQMSFNPYVAMDHPADRFIAPPFSRGTEGHHLKLALYDSITTSVALLVRAPE